MTGTLTVTGLFAADRGTFVSRPVDGIDLTLDGVPGDLHGGPTRRTGGREPWHPRGTVIRNDRQISILGDEELAVIAAAMGLPRLPADWIGANLTLSGRTDLSLLPAGARLMAPSGATILVTAYNAPCRQSGRAVAERSGVPDHEFGFVKAAKGRRGLVGYVERAGALAVGDLVTVIGPKVAS